MPAASLRQAAIALALTFAAGFVDGYGFLSLSGVYIGNMSGNTVQIALRAVAGDGGQALLHAFTISMFLLGLLVSGAAIELGRSRRLRHVFAIGMALEVIGLGLFILLVPDPNGARPPPARLLAGIAVAALAMGLQNTSLRMANVLTAYTTHVTGTITRFSEDFVAWLFARRAPDPEDPSERKRLGRGAVLSGLLWVAFLLGSFAAALLLPRLSRIALAIPLLIVIVAGAADAVAPLSEHADSGGRRRH
jgi:uncharacterized membrane protein YoaK (UPF0700 family)